ncbi:MAG: heme NO-binding protein [Phycisphaerales bacterium]|nr:heme NO-binding protein [Phycisphaerales bacterium]
MYGLVNKAVEGLIRSKYGDETWGKIRSEVGVPDEPFISMGSYDDAVTYNLVGVTCTVLNLPADVVLEEFGKYWVLFTGEAGYGRLLENAGTSFPTILRNLDALHTRVKLSFPNLQPPSFRVAEESEQSLVLHYHSHRAGLAPFVVGLLKGLASRFNVDAEITHVRVEGDAAHDTFFIRWNSIS